MTYIEFFDQTASENISACLTYAPERVIYITDSAKLVKKHISNYEKIFADRGQKIDFLVETVSKSNLDSAIELLTRLINTYDDCVFDITGGEEIYILALGMVCSQNPDKKIQIHKFNLRNNTLYDCDKDGVTIYRDAPMLTIDENIRLYGGEVAYGTVEEANTYKWNLTPDFLEDLQLIWDVYKEDVRYWNMQMCILEAAEIVGNPGSDALTTVASRAALEQHLEDNGAKYKVAKGIISALLKHGLLTYFDDDGTDITVSYKNPQVKKCLTKAGQALEMKIFVMTKDVRGKDGTPVYHDALNGVVIDWDGEFHDEAVEDQYDTENEIDIMLMHGVVPVFISCKSGIVTADELYKLNTVAERFGGRYSKKVLVATSISELGESGNYLKQRAEDMNIKLIDGVQSLTDAELEKKLKHLWTSG